jgi:hypothetical protein
MLEFLEEMLDKIGARESCSASERRLGQVLADRWRNAGFEVRQEKFTCHPKAFLDAIRIAVLCYFVAIGLYWIAPLAAALLGALHVALIFLEVLNYRQVVDRLFPLREGENVMAVVAPRVAARRRIIVNAHLDSAYEYTLWYRLKGAAVPLMIVGVLAAFIPMLGGVLTYSGLISEPLSRAIGWFGIGLSPLIAAFLFFRSSRVVPGAMDDLAGLSVLYGLGRLLSDELTLETTEVVLLATAAEEAGLRGAMAYAHAHRDEHARIPTLAIVIDGVYDERYLGVVHRELLAFTQYDADLIDRARRAAAARGWPMIDCNIPLGATDGTAFARAGLRSVALVCQDTSRLVPNYHTRLDTCEYVRSESLYRVLQVVTDMLRAIDKGTKGGVDEAPAKSR